MKVKRTLGKAAAITALGMFMILGCFVFFLSEFSMSESKSVNTQKFITTEENLLHSVGRFDFLLPKTWQLGGRTQIIYTLKVWNEDVEPESDIQQLWETHLSVLKSNATAAKADAFIREALLPSGLSGAWIKASLLYPNNLKLLVMRPITDHALFLEAEASAGRESIAEGVVAEIANGYVPFSPDGFSVGKGAFVMKAASDEHAGVVFNYNGMSLSIDTDTVSETDPIQSDIVTQNFIEAIREDGSEIEILHKSNRVVTGFTGKEERVQLKEKGKESELFYYWVYPGKRVGGLEPRIMITGNASLSNQKDFDSAWNQLLDSFRKRKLGVP